MVTIVCDSGFATVRVSINGIVHLHIARKDFRGFQSWLFIDQRSHAIEISLADTPPMRLEYATLEIWKGVVEALDSAFY